MATSDEPPHAGLAGGLSLGAWVSPQSFDVPRRPPSDPFWNTSHPSPSSSSFLDLNAPFEEDPQPVSRGLPQATNRLVSGPGESLILLNSATEVAGENPYSVADSTSFSRSRPYDGDEESMARDQESAGSGVESFVDYLSQISGKKESNMFEKDRSKATALRDASDLPDELLSLSSSYHRKRGERGESDQVGGSPADGATLALSSCGAQDVMNTRTLENCKVGRARTGPVVMNFDSHKVDDLSDLRDPGNLSRGRDADSGFGMEEKALFPRIVSQVGRTGPLYTVGSAEGEGSFLPADFARDTLELSNSIGSKHKGVGASSVLWGLADFSKESTSLSLKRPVGNIDQVEGYKKRRQEENLPIGLDSGEVDARGEMDTRCNSVGVAHKEGSESASGVDGKVLNKFKIVPTDRGDGVDKTIVWPPIVIIENTRLSWDDERSQWKGMGIDDVRKSLKEVDHLDYAKVKCLYDQHGQKSSVLVIFPPTLEGFYEAGALHDQLERSGKGKDQWMKVRPQDANPRSLRGFNTPALISADGQRILYGYLAQPEDIQRADPHKNGFKWFVESFNEKVRKPAQQRHQMSSRGTSTPSLRPPTAGP